MTGTRQVLFIQGGGAGARDERDGKLAGSMRRDLGGQYEVCSPRMREEGGPGYARRGTAIRREMAALNAGAGGWPGAEFEGASDLGARLPPRVRVHVFHGLLDETASGVVRERPSAA